MIQATTILTKNLLRVCVLGASAILLLTAQGCPEDTNAKATTKATTPAKPIALTSDGAFATTVIKVNAHGAKIRAIEPLPNCKWYLYYEYNGNRQLIKTGGFRNTTVNLDSKKTFFNKKTKKSYIDQANLFVTKNCRTWVKK